MTAKKTNAKQSLADTIKDKLKEQVAKAAGLDLEALAPIANAAKEAAAAAQESIEETILSGCEMIARAQFAARFVHMTNDGLNFEKTLFEEAWAALMDDESDEMPPVQEQ